MTEMNMTANVTFMSVLAIVIALVILHQYDPSILQSIIGSSGRKEGFEDHDEVDKMADSCSSQKKGAVNESSGKAQKKVLSENKHLAKNVREDEEKKEREKEGFADLSAYEGPADFATVMPPEGCYPRDQLTPSELLPTDQNSVWAQQNPMGPGSLKGKNFLSAGALIGVNTVGQSLRNANMQLRSEPPNPQAPVSIFMQSTIGPDMNRRPLEISS